jgi:hypothetical protein
MLDSATIETVDRYWMSDLGCSRDVLYSQQSLIVPHSASLSDYHGIFIFLRDEPLLISVPRSLIDVFHRNAGGWSPSAVLQEDRLRTLVGYPAEQVIGPAFMGYTNRANFRPTPAGGAQVLGSSDGRVILWDPQRHQQIGEPLIHGGRVESVAFSPDGKVLASGSSDGRVILWDVDIESWKDRACYIANRNLTLSEWAQYLENEPYHRTCPNMPEGH